MMFKKTNKMTNYNFWESWKNKTEIEKKAIEKVIKARDLVIKSIPKNALVAIYIKGSFTRREMNEQSDVDIVPIVTENEYEGDVFSVNGPKINPVMVVPLSLWELKNNQLSTKSNNSPDLRARPDRFLKYLDQCKLIYGEPLNPAKFLIRNDNAALKEEIKTIKNGYIKAYLNGKIEFSPLLKEVFWLVELEQKNKGIEVNHSFEGILNSVKDKNHIINDAFKFRTGEYNKKEIELFIIKLQKYLSNLENEIE